MKSDVDSFTNTEQWIPTIQLQAYPRDKNATLDYIQCNLNLVGAKSPTELSFRVPFSPKDLHDQQGKLNHP